MRKFLLFCSWIVVTALSAQQSPIMGWSSWNTYRVNISDSLIMRQASALVHRGLKQYGYQYVNIDDGYFGGRDAEGVLLTHPLRFPNGLKPTVGYIHSLGLKAGIYSDAGRNTCGSFWDKDSVGIGVGLYGHEEQDVDWFFNTCGFDFIKIDFCGGDAKQNLEHLDLDVCKRYTQIRQTLLKCVPERDIQMNVCRWDFPGTWVCNVGDSWRISQDINPSWESVKDIISQNLYLSAYAQRGRYNDMDMLEIGRGLSREEEKTHFGMWCIMSSPLLIGCNIETLSEESLQLLCNRELIALNQDSLGIQAYPIKYNDDGTYVLVKDIVQRQGCERAVAIYNPTDKDHMVTVAFADLDLEGKIKVRDLFKQQDAGVYTSATMCVKVPAHGTRIYRMKGEKRKEQQIYEAENAWIEGYQELVNPYVVGHAFFAFDKNCSAGAKVTNLGGCISNFIEWRHVYSHQGGEYVICFDFASDQSGSMIVCVNGKEYPFSWLAGQTCGKLKVSLKGGDNRVRIFHPQNMVPDIDRMVIFPKS